MDIESISLAVFHNSFLIKMSTKSKPQYMISYKMVDKFKF